ncbi:hypothetical protein B0H13DRAFT_1864104 [Mycena leptocephala]|nr:hypothetical protein B0H13DRAFT_1864104 [Mycena leptocephala]
MSDPSDPAPPVLAFDPVSIKATKWLVLFSLELVETGFATHEAWYFSVENWGNFAALGGSPWTADVHVIAVGVACAGSMHCCNRRDRIGEENDAAPGIHQELTRYAQVAKIPTEFELLKVHPVYSFWLVASFVTDILILGSMVWILYTSKDMTFTSTTNNLLDRLIINSVQTGGVTVACAGATLILFLKSTDTVYYGIPLYMLGKLYSNSLVATLNARNSPKRAGLWDPVELHLSAQADTESGRDRTGQTWNACLVRKPGTVTAFEVPDDALNGSEVEYPFGGVGLLQCRNRPLDFRLTPHYLKVALCHSGKTVRLLVSDTSAHLQQALNLGTLFRSTNVPWCHLDEGEQLAPPRDRNIVMVCSFFSLSLTALYRCIVTGLVKRSNSIHAIDILPAANFAPRA